jgi:hypothetical protein
MFDGSIEGSFHANDSVARVLLVALLKLAGPRA